MFVVFFSIFILIEILITHRISLHDEWGIIIAVTFLLMVFGFLVSFLGFIVHEQNLIMGRIYFLIVIMLMVPFNYLMIAKCFS